MLYILPRFIKYGIADFLAFILHRVVKYRVGVVRQNLKNSFPNKNSSELNEIERGFYANLADIFVEIMTIQGFGKKQIKERMTYENAELIDNNKSHSTLATMAHYGMWEYTIGYALRVPEQNVYAVYHPLTSKVMEIFFKQLRSKFGAKPLAMADVAKQIICDKRENRCSNYALIADQTPPRPQIKFRYNFLGQSTPFFSGAEKLALKYKLPVYFIDIIKVKRGFYRGNVIEIYDGVSPVEPHFITKKYVELLEAAIERDPSMWMWSHKRWKHIPLEGEIDV